MNTKCNKNFQSQYAYINEQPIHINDYISLFKNNKNIYCYKGHKIHHVEPFR